MAIKFILLGTGSSIGVPRIDGNFGACDPKIKKNYRTRCSALIKFDDQNILFDTSPDLRNQLLANNIKNIQKVFYTHNHADQTHGINDLRVFYLKNKKVIPIYADLVTSKYLSTAFSYCFKKNFEYPAILKLNKLKKKHIFKNKNKKIFIRSVEVEHGNIKSMCYIINKSLAYASDVSLIHKKDLRLFKKLNYFIIDCLRYKEHYSHYNLNKILELVKIIKPKKTILTNMNNELDYKVLKKNLPNNIVPGFDGMTINL